ncbi:MAG: hypothetical protein GY868_05390 [Deltaproteobacteria bacterium]|nr:hypothetical protein [Deltaproteobacteria bacterium]
MFIVCVAAVDEIRYLKKRLDLKSKKVISGTVFYTGLLGGRELLLVHTGVGPRRARAAAKKIVALYAPERVLVIGAAGGIDPGLQVGDIVCAQSVIAGQGHEYPADREWLQHAQAVLGRCGYAILSGRALAVKGFVHSWRDKKELHDRSGCQVVDMESGALARVFAEAGISWCTIRIVSDSAHADTVNFELLLKERRRAPLLGIMRYVLRCPSEALKLLKLKMGLRRAGRLIRDIVTALANE